MSTVSTQLARAAGALGPTFTVAITAMVVPEILHVHPREVFGSVVLAGTMGRYAFAANAAVADVAFNADGTATVTTGVFSFLDSHTQKRQSATAIVTLAAPPSRVAFQVHALTGALLAETEVGGVYATVPLTTGAVSIVGGTGA